MISNTLYAQYIDERQGLKIIEDEHGFITYKIKDEECFLAEMFVRKEYRRAGYGAKLLDRLIETAQGCEYICANIWLWDPNANGTLAGALASGFKLARTGDGFIKIVLDLKRGK